jgi:hypothetical protein
MARDISLGGIATGYGLDDRVVGVRVPVGSRIFSSQCCPDRLGNVHRTMLIINRLKMLGESICKYTGFE